MLYQYASNPQRGTRAAQSAALAPCQNLGDWSRAVREIHSWPEYRPQPAWPLTALAQRARVGEVVIQDESQRFGRAMASFKALGAPYAIYRLLARAVSQRLGVDEPSAEQLRSGHYSHLTKDIVVTVATDGNQGRGIAYGAHVFGCRAVVYVHAHVSAARRQAMQQLGALVIRVDGEYEASVARAREDARMNGWHFVSSTSWDDFSGDIARDVMHGYMVMVEEAAARFAVGQEPTHVFVHGGVGSIVAAVFLGLHQKGWRSRFVAVEPLEAACLYESAVAGHPQAARGSLKTVMAGLACREVSPAAWKILEWLGSDFVAVPDEWALDGMRALAAGTPPVVCGESSAAAVGLLLSADAGLRQRLGLGPESRVLLFGCEGATDPVAYEKIVGQSADTVFLRQSQSA